VDPVLSAVLSLYVDAHQQIRALIANLEADALEYTPAPGTNSIAVLVVHTLGSEAEALRIVAGVPNQRDRDAEFRPSDENVHSLLQRLDAAGQFLNEITPKLTSERLATKMPRGDRAPETGLYWLVRNYGHEREHLAHMELTLQMYRNVSKT